MNVELNTNLEVPFIFVTTEQHQLAIDIVNNTVHYVDDLDGISAEQAEVELEMSQNWDEQTTEYSLLGETIVMSGNEVFVK